MGRSPRLLWACVHAVKRGCQQAAPTSGALGPQLLRPNTLLGPWSGFTAQTARWSLLASEPQLRHAHGAAAAAAIAAAATAPAATAAAGAVGAERRRTSRGGRAHVRGRLLVDNYTRPPTNYVQLLQHIGTAKTLPYLQHLVAQYRDRFDAVHVAAAMVKLPKLVRLAGSTDAGGSKSQPARPLSPQTAAGTKEVLSELQGMALNHVEALYARQIANMMWALGTCHNLNGGRQPGSQARTLTSALLAELMRNGARKLYEGGNAQDVAQVLYGLARLRLGGGHPWMSHKDRKAPPRLRLLRKYLLRNITSFQARDCALVSWALGRLRWRDVAVMSALAQQAHTQRWYLRPWSAAALLCGYAKLHVRQLELVGGVAEVTQEQAYAFTPRTLATTTWAAGRLGLPAQQADVLAVAAADRALPHLPSFGSLELGLLLEGLQSLKALQQPQPQVMDLLQAVAQGLGEEEALAVSVRDGLRLLRSLVAARRALVAHDRGDALAAAGGRLAAALEPRAAQLLPTQALDAATCVVKLGVRQGSDGGGGEQGSALLELLCAQAAATAGAAAGGGGGGGAPRGTWRLTQLAALVAVATEGGVVHEGLCALLNQRLLRACTKLSALTAQRPGAPLRGRAAALLDAGSDAAIALAAANRLQVASAAALAAAAAPQVGRTGGLRARKAAMLLEALAGKVELLQAPEVEDFFKVAVEWAEKEQQQQQPQAAADTGDGGGGSASDASVELATADALAAGGGAAGAAHPAPELVVVALPAALARAQRDGPYGFVQDALLAGLFARAAQQAGGMPDKQAARLLAAATAAGVPGEAAAAAVRRVAAARCWAAAA